MSEGKNPKVDEFLNHVGQWQKELSILRDIVLDCGLSEELKWGKPCYTANGSNIVLIHGFKEYCAILFMKGTLLKDPQGILVQQTENVQAGRQIRFQNADEIDSKATVIKEYIKEAIEVEKSGVEVEFKKHAEYAVPDELQAQFDGNPALKTAFEGLTPGRQRGYLLYFSAPKQSKTKVARIEKYIPKILNGKGLDD